MATLTSYEEAAGAAQRGSPWAAEAWEGETGALKSKRFSSDPDLQGVMARTALLARRGTKASRPVRSAGTGVHLVQRSLIDLGFGLPKYGADGKFGPETAGAVRKFQAGRPGLSSDGIVGPSTLAALDAVIAQREGTITPPAPPVPPPTPPVTKLHPSATYWKDVLKIGLPNNRVEPLIDGPAAFAAMKRAIESTQTRGHYVYLLGWWCDPWVNLAGPGTSLLDLFGRAGRAGVQIRGLLWDPSSLVYPNHAKLHSAAVAAINRLPNCHFQLDDAPGTTKSHHQKLLIVRGSQGLVAMAGGVDVNADRIHALPPPTHAYRADRPSDIGWVGASGGSGSGSGPGGSGEPLHDVHALITGPNALPLQRAFLRRWWSRSGSRAVDNADPLRGGFNDSLPPATGTHFVRVGETFNGRLREPGKFPIDSRKVDAQDIWLRCLLAARRSIYMEEQYLSHPCAAMAINRVLPRLDHVIILIPPSGITDFPGRWERRMNFIRIASAGPHGHKVRVYTRAVDPGQACRRSGRHVYVHAKTAMIDDELAIIGSANCNHRGWETDSELAVAVFEQIDGRVPLAKQLRMRLWAEHLGVSASLLGDPTRTKGLWDTAPTRNVCRYDPRGGTDPFLDGPKKLVSDPADSRFGDPCRVLL
jgi:phosphatidylserine/phosphatidylglycerophosphate/cardiolipin synthase-like enzyme